jgi:LysW-gamma-L-lysine carboxypeptidase
MIELLERCVRIPSLSGQERNVAVFLRDEMIARGFDRAFIDDAGNAVGVIGEGKRQLVLLGHMDTVGGEVPVRYEDRNLYGRGAVDAKGPLCAFILAASNFVNVERVSTLHSEHLRSEAERTQLGKDWQLIVIGATEEETASSKGARFAATQYSPQLCVVGEPSGSNGVTLGYKGRLLVDARVEQASHHTARPESSANEIAVNAWNAFKTFCNEYNSDKPKVFDQIMPSLRSIRSGDDGLKEWCDLTLAARLPVEFGPDSLQQEIERIFSELDMNTFQFRGHECAHRDSKDSPLAREFVEAIRAENLRPAFKLKTGTADMNVVAPVWKCPIVAYGPGDSSLDHTPNEHIAIDEFERGVKVLTRVIAKIAQ